MHHEATLISTIAIGFVLAFGFGYVADRLRLPPLVGYLVAGILIGPYTPGFVADAGLSAQLAEVGVILLMFGVGLHFSASDLLAVRGIAIPGAIGQIVLATLLGIGMCSLWGWSFGTGLVVGLSLSVASTVVLLKALEERNLVDSPNGRVAVGWLIVEDLAMVLALVLLPAFAEVLGGKPIQGHEPSGMPIALELAVTLSKVAAFAVIAILIGPKVVPWMLARVARTGSRELFTLSVLAVALGIAYGSAHIFGVSFALGAFFAGVVLSESSFSHKAAADLAAAAGRLLGAVLRLGRHAVRSDDPLPLAGRGAGGAGADHLRQVDHRLRHHHAAALPDRHRPHGVGQPGADRRVLLHPDRARHFGRARAERGPRPGGRRRALLDHAEPAGLLRRRPAAEALRPAGRCCLLRPASLRGAGPPARRHQGPPGGAQRRPRTSSCTACWNSSPCCSSSSARTRNRCC